MAYTTIDDPSAYFQIALYTGTSSSVAVTNGGNSDLQPDLVWIKRRDSSASHMALDSTRGVTKRIRPDTYEAEDTDANDFSSFNSDGFTVGTDDNANLNGNNNTYVAWQWKANGGTRTTNTESGNNPAGGYQANTTAGFSIVDYTGTGAAGTMAHGLGVVPKVIMVKNRSQATDWMVYHASNTSAPETDNLTLNDVAGTADNADMWNDTAPTSSVFTIGSHDRTNDDSETLVAYCWTDIQGYSKFGSYKGNGNADGPFIYLGFKPKYFLLKNATIAAGSSGQHWQISDTERHPFNPLDATLLAESDTTEGHTWSIKDFLSNGVKIRGSNYAMNQNGDTYVYMAFAEHPFVSSEGVPCTAR